MTWLRRRIIKSIATQTAGTFAVSAVIVFAGLYWATSQFLISLVASILLGQLAAIARVGHALYKNPLNYPQMRDYVARPFDFRVARFQGNDIAHPDANGLPGFVPVATIRSERDDAESVFDLYHDASRLVAASVHRTSGAVALISSLSGGRVLSTSATVVPPHEQRVMNIAEDGKIPTLIATHQRAITHRADVVEVASSAHQVVLATLALEHESFVGLGPLLSPFLDLQFKNWSPFRLSARIGQDELTALPTELGPDLAARPVRPFEGFLGTNNPKPAPGIVASISTAPEMVPAGIESIDITVPVVTAPDIVELSGLPRRQLSAPATLAEAVMPAPDTASALLDDAFVTARDAGPGPSQSGGGDSEVVGFANITPRVRPRLSEKLRDASNSSSRRGHR